MHVDLAIFHAVNGLCGNPLLDRVAAYEENNYFFKGGIFLALYWWFWFDSDRRRRERNRRVIAMVIVGTIVALASARALAVMLPFRVRPMYAAGVGYHAPSIAFALNLEHWSSFPSDSATYWFALSYGLYRLNRPLGLIAMVYSTLWMCLVRLYLGIHYPSDLVAGAILGLTVVWLVERLLIHQDAILRRVMRRLAGVEADHPQVFYAAAFIVSFELTMMFDDVRGMVRGVMRVLHYAGYTDVGEAASLFIFAISALLLIGVVASAIMLVRRRQRTASHAKRGLQKSTELSTS